MIDFSSLVLAPGMATFAKPITITPSASQPAAADYPARGIWEIENVKIVTEDGGSFSNRTLKISVRVAEFTVLPAQGDIITTDAKYLPLGYGAAGTMISFVVDDQNPDGQGEAKLTLKKVVP